MDSTGLKTGASDIVWRRGALLMDSNVDNERVIAVSSDDGDAVPSRCRSLIDDGEREEELSSFGLMEETDRLSDVFSLDDCSED